MFGRPSRTATQDANEQQATAITTSTPADSRMAGGQLLTRPDQGNPNVAKAAIDITRSIMSEADKNKMDAATVRQGQSEAINEIDAANKRTGFAKWVFGQDAGYATAQKLAVQNATNADYQTMMISSQTDAHMTEQEYLQKMHTVRQDRLDMYKGDAAAQAAVLETWLPMQNKLVREQAVRHYKYGQEQAHNEGVKQLVGEFDNYTLEMNDTATPQSQMEGKQAFKELFSRQKIDEKATPEATKLMKLEAVTRAVSAGNLTPYNVMMEEQTYYNSLTPVQQDMVDQAISKNDDIRIAEMANMTSSAETAALEGDINAYTRTASELSRMDARISGSDKSTTALNRARSSMLKAQQRLQDNWATKAVAEEQAGMDFAAYASGDTVAIASQDMTPKRRKAAANNFVLAQATSMNPEWNEQSEITSAEAIDYYLQNEPFVKDGKTQWPMAELAKSLEARGGGASIVDTMTTQAINGFALGNDLGAMTKQKQKEIEAMVAFKRAAPQSFKANVGSDAYAELAIIERGITRDVKEIQTDINNYRANKHLAGTLSSSSMGLQSGESKYDWLQNMVGNIQGAKPTDRTMQYYLEELDRGFMITQSVQGAKDYVRTSIIDRNVNYHGHVIPNGKFLEEDMYLGENHKGYEDTLPTVLQAIDRSPMMAELLKTRIPLYNQQEDNRIDSLSQVPGLSMSVNLSNNSLEIASPAFAYPIVLNEDQLRGAADFARQKYVSQEYQAEQAKKKAFDRKIMSASGIVGGN